ncbi:virulence factor BrkB family protein [Candidatus Endoriftia persephonae]|jgi:membrane protein|uniref:UPF0761 membrane protein TevJSym_af00790 n=2 Tax=Gammaproteobacteria TaxID=1236 RepID=G2FDQ9_9GAMM|nr:virulence factor BrkB family protein [Candidatus Endoriftia persephone]EGW55114.1 YihY family protein or ribonuclease BN-like protein [endosymbiont of Tevnia jerichonana (vent Tica)]USF88279.1 virulence factor BrkB family protein [Candidatus Endoriftia persephone]
MTRDISAEARRYLDLLCQFSSLLFHHFAKDGGIQNTAALTYTTLLSLVPLMTVMLALFSAFPGSEKAASEIENFVFQNFVPAAGEIVQEHLRNFSQKAGRLSGVGFGFLFVVALMLMANIDKAFNTIWHVRKKRKPIATFLVYWAILSLGPILIVVSVGVTSYLVSLPIFIEDATVVQLRTRLLGVMPVLISALAFTLLYALVPNRNVPLRHAFAGGVLAALLFETAKRGFALYVTQFPTYEAIYGAMAAIPIFLIWIWLSWLVTLLGAEFTYCLGIYRHNWREKFYSRGASFLLAFRLIGYLREVQQEGGQLSTAELTEREPEAGEERIEAALKALQAAHLVLRSEDRGWALARDLRETSLLELYHADHFVLPTAGDVETESPRLAELLASLDQDLISKLQQPLDDLYA